MGLHAGLIALPLIRVIFMKVYIMWTRYSLLMQPVYDLTGNSPDVWPQNKIKCPSFDRFSGSQHWRTQSCYWRILHMCGTWFKLTIHFVFYEQVYTTQSCVQLKLINAASKSSLVWMDAWRSKNPELEYFIPVVNHINSKVLFFNFHKPNL